jgi:hypothetical protein
MRFNFNEWIAYALDLATPNVQRKKGCSEQEEGEQEVATVGADYDPAGHAMETTGVGYGSVVYISRTRCISPRTWSDIILQQFCLFITS